MGIAGGVKSVEMSSAAVCPVVLRKLRLETSGKKRLLSWPWRGCDVIVVVVGGWVAWSERRTQRLRLPLLLLLPLLRVGSEDGDTAMMDEEWR